MTEHEKGQLEAYQMVIARASGAALGLGSFKRIEWRDATDPRSGLSLCDRAQDAAIWAALRLGAVWGFVIGLTISGRW